MSRSIIFFCLSRPEFTISIPMPEPTGLAPMPTGLIDPLMGRLRH